MPEMGDGEGWWHGCSSLAWPSISILGMILLVVSMVSLVQSIDRREAATRQSASVSSPAAITPNSPTPKVTAFDVRVLRDGDPVAADRLIGASLWQASCGDSIRVTARLNTPAYAYLLSLTPDSGITVVDPPGRELVPQRSDVIAYPRSPQHAARLSQGPGLQGLLLLVSAEPLPEFEHWPQGRQLRWPSTQAIGAWRSNGRALERWESGGPVESNGVFDPPRTVSRMFSAMKRLEGVDACELIAFPVRLTTD